VDTRNAASDRRVVHAGQIVEDEGTAVDILHSASRSKRAAWVFGEDSSAHHREHGAKTLAAWKHGVVNCVVKGLSARMSTLRKVRQEGRFDDALKFLKCLLHIAESPPDCVSFPVIHLGIVIPNPDGEPVRLTCPIQTEKLALSASIAELISRSGTTFVLGYPPGFVVDIR